VQLIIGLSAIVFHAFTAALLL